MTRDITLSAAILGPSTLPKQAALVIGGSLVIALAAQASVPMIPVPMTLQTLAILLVGLVYGARLGTATVAAYLAEGAAGLPVFANASGGAAHLVGPTGGFLFGFLAMAWLAGMVSDRGIRGVLPVAALCVLISALLYLPGAGWAMAADRLFGIDTAAWGADSLGSVWTYYIAPFLIGDAVKSVIAALVVAGGWAALRARRG